jgi:hypothetical protein
MKDFTGLPSCEQRYFSELAKQKSGLLTIASYLSVRIMHVPRRIVKKDKNARTYLSILCSLHYFFNNYKVRKYQFNRCIIIDCN